MNREYFRSAKAWTFAAALGAAIVLSAAPGRAQGDEGRQYRRGDRPQAPPSERAQPSPAPSGGGEKWRRGDEGRRDGGGAPGGGEKWRRGDVERRDRGGWSGGWSGGGREYDGRRYRGGDRDRGWYGGGGYCPPPRPRYWHRPHRVIRVGIGFNYYYPYGAHRHYSVRRPVVREYLPQIDVENEPPAGCYYWDPYCEREWNTLDEYTEHLDGADHGDTIEILDESSGEWVRTLVFVDGYWSVRR